MEINGNQQDSQDTDLEAIKNAIGLVNSKPLDTHPQEYEKIFNSLNKALNEIDGL